MTKKLDDMAVPCTVSAPRSKGCVTIDIGKCFACNQSEPAKISVLNENVEMIEASTITDNGNVFTLQCDECGHVYKLGVISVESKTPSGSLTCSSMFSADVKDGKAGPWQWLGIC